MRTPRMRDARRRQQIPTQSRVSTHTYNRHKNTSSSVRHAASAMDIPRPDGRATSMMTLDALQRRSAQRAPTSGGDLTGGVQSAAETKQHDCAPPRRGDGRSKHSQRRFCARGTKAAHARATRPDSPAHAPAREVISLSSTESKSRMGCYLGVFI